MTDAESHAEEDKRRKEEVETRKQADHVVYEAEKMVRDTGDKLAGPDKAAIESAVGELRKAIDGNDTAAMKRAMDSLRQAQHKAAEALYRQSGAAGPGSAPGPEASTQTEPQEPTAGATQGDVIDAEVVDEEKR